MITETKIEVGTASDVNSHTFKSMDYSIKKNFFCKQMISIMTENHLYQNSMISRVSSMKAKNTKEFLSFLEFGLW